MILSEGGLEAGYFVLKLVGQGCVCSFCAASELLGAEPLGADTALPCRERWTERLATGEMSCFVRLEMHFPFGVTFLENALPRCCAIKISDKSPSVVSASGESI